MKGVLGNKPIAEIRPTVVKRYQTSRLAENAGGKSINDEIMLLLRLCGETGGLIRSALKREKSLKLKLPPSPGKDSLRKRSPRTKASGMVNVRATPLVTIDEMDQGLCFHELTRALRPVSESIVAPQRAKLLNLLKLLNLRDVSV